MTSRRMLLLAGLLWVLSCGPPRSNPGGTPGRIHVNGTPLADVMVTVYRRDGGTEPIALAISGSDGQFALREPGSLEAVSLEPGRYQLTIESAGEFYRRWPPEFAKPDQTPLQKTWSAEDRSLDLDVPAPKVPL